MTESTQADRDAAAEAFFCKPLLNEKHNDDRRVRAFARHRQYGYDQGYYDGRQADGAEERAKIVAYARGHGGNAWSRDVLYFSEKVEAGEHLK
jgi:hypothetical protein